MQDALTTFTLPSGEIKALYIQREGPLLVMIHGFPGRPQDFKRLIEALDSCSILALALPGCGVSPSPKQLSYGNLVLILLELIDSLSPKSLYLLGHSFGAALATTVASERRVSGLCLIFSVGLRPHRAMRKSARFMYPVFRYTPLYWLKKNHSTSVSLCWLSQVSFESMWDSCQLAWALITTYKQNISRITAPCFMVHSADDPNRN